MLTVCRNVMVTNLAPLANSTPCVQSKKQDVCTTLWVDFDGAELASRVERTSQELRRGIH